MPRVAAVASLSATPPRFSRHTDDFPRALTWSTTGQELAWGTAAGTVEIVAAKDGTTIGSARLPGTGVAALAFHPRLPRLCAGGEDGSLTFLDVAGASVQEVLPATGAWAEHVAWNPKGSKLAAARGRAAVVLSAEGSILIELAEVESTITGLAWSPDGSQIACACYGGVRLFDAKTGKQQRGLDWKGSMISLAWRPGGRVIACGCQDGSVHFWRLPAGKDSQMSGYPLKPKAIGWSHDGRLLATAGAPEITVWKFEGKGPEGTRPIELSAHEEPVTALAFAPLVDMLATGCRAGEGYFWTPQELTRPVRRFEMTARIESLQWTLAPAEENVLLAAADAAGRVGVWVLR
jgi:WD40 repeat protein